MCLLLRERTHAERHRGYGRCCKAIFLLLTWPFVNVTLPQGEEGQFKSFICLRNQLDELVERLAKAELEEFELDASADYKSTTATGLYHNEAAVLLRDTYEVRKIYLKYQRKEKQRVKRNRRKKKKKRRKEAKHSTKKR